MSEDLRRVKAQWEQRIEHMLTRPLMFSANPHAFEDSFRTAIKAWEVMDRVGGKKSGRSALTFVWGHVLKDAYEKFNADYEPQVAAFHRIRKRDGADEPLIVTEVIPYLRRVWERLRDPIERLAAISEDE